MRNLQHSLMLNGRKCWTIAALIFRILITPCANANLSLPREEGELSVINPEVLKMRSSRSRALLVLVALAILVVSQSGSSQSTPLASTDAQATSESLPALDNRL